ncbi:MAG: YkgJ family cysteine cluster protein [Planctomycetes bacterium]|nr:YkgJ family cysteine cluster protein [Planctomycetota bacterium]
MSKKQTDYCRDCDKMCCKYFTVPTGKPEDEHDVDALVWYILHEGVSVFIDGEGDWYVNISSPCRKLGPDGLCTIYKKRPLICREHNDEVCEKNDDGYDFKEHFFTAKELKAYAKAYLAKKRKKAAKKGKKGKGGKGKKK